MTYVFKEDYTATYYQAGNSIAVPFKRGTRVNGEFVAAYTTPGGTGIVGPMNVPASVHIDNPDYNPLQQGDAYYNFALPPRKLFIPPSKLLLSATRLPNAGTFGGKVGAIDRLEMIVQMPSFWIAALVLYIIYIKSK